MRFLNESLGRTRVTLTFTLALALILLQAVQKVQGLAITMGHCEKNISVKYQVPVTKTRRLPASASGHMGDLSETSTRSENHTEIEVYVDYEERSRWDVVQVCCPGYRSIIFGLCEALCRDDCPPHSHCVEPDKCECGRGYQASHHPNKEHQLICRPSCSRGCPEHSHCVAPGVCECRAGYRDVSAWFGALRCERIHCGPDHRYDIGRKGCVRIDMTMEQLMRTVGERLAHGLQSKDGDDTDEDEEDGEATSNEQ